MEEGTNDQGTPRDFGHPAGVGRPFSRPIANSPLNFGVFDNLAPTAPAMGVLAAVADAGYDGIDLGPVGYLGAVGEIADRLRHHGLALSGAYIDLHLSTGQGFSDDLARLERALDLLDAAPVGAAPARPTLADAGDRARRAHPVDGPPSPGHRLDERGWQTFTGRLTQAVARCRSRGFEPTFHHHVCTAVESLDEIAMLLTVSDVAICLDTAHLAMVGGDPVAALRTWGDRIGQVHLKDIDLAAMRQVVDAGGDMDALWGHNCFRELGAGDVDLDSVLAAIDHAAPNAWVVVEQDWVPGEAHGFEFGFEGAVAAQRANRAWLASRGW